MRLADKVAIVVGAGQTPGDTIGNGRATAMTFAREGARLLVVDINGASAEETVAMIREEGGTAFAFEADATRAKECKAFAARAKGAFGRIDILVNNAGIGYLMQDFMDVPLDEWKIVLDVNLTGAFMCTQAAAKHMIEAGNGGRIINIASQAAKSGFPNLAAYVASKHGMVGLTRSNAIELGKLMGAKVIDAEEAFTVGLATRLFAPEELETGTRAFASELASLSQFTIRGVKTIVGEILAGAHDETETSRTLSARAFDGPDYTEGRDAFLEKRTPKFTYR